MIQDDWLELCDTLRDTAEGFAATDSQNAWRYREEAAEFRALPAPETADEFSLREAESHLLRQCWSERFRQRRNR